MKNILPYLMLILSVLLFCGYPALAQEYTNQEDQAMVEGLKVSKICSDNKVFIIVQARSKFVDIKAGGLGIGIGITQVLEEENGKLVPAYCE